MKSDPAPVDVSLCWNCGLCMEHCPAEIPIPDMLQIYRQYHVNSADALAALGTSDFPAYPIDCIECSACSAACPKKFDPAGMIRTLAMASCNTF